jgi:hypothetical protein
MRLYKHLFIVILFIVSVQPASANRADVQIVSDEARAVLSILEKRQTNQPITDTDWQKIFQSEGYVRLKKREASVKRPFEDETFKSFVLSDDLLKRFDSLRATLAEWEKAQVENSARKASNYLPADASIRAKIYPVIKPRDNSFVFEVKENPAIFLYLDPSVTKAQFENTLAHELHHIGFGTACPKAATDEELKLLPEEKQTVFRWVGAFGEGLAMLAAAGGADTHPHKFSKPEDRARWDADVKNFDSNLREVEAFFDDVLAKRLTGAPVSEKAFTFFGTQGAWYTVGWKMSVVIEKTFGRRKLIEVFCDPRKLLPTYNEAARLYRKKSGENLAVWSDELLNQLK